MHSCANGSRGATTGRTRTGRNGDEKQKFRSMLRNFRCLDWTEPTRLDTAVGAKNLPY
jgi:hypothetical protein